MYFNFIRKEGKKECCLKINKPTNQEMGNLNLYDGKKL